MILSVSHVVARSCLFTARLLSAIRTVTDTFLQKSQGKCNHLSNNLLHPPILCSRELEDLVLQQHWCAFNDVTLAQTRSLDDCKSRRTFKESRAPLFAALSSASAAVSGRPSADLDRRVTLVRLACPSESLFRNSDTGIDGFTSAKYFACVTMLQSAVDNRQQLSNKTQFTLEASTPRGQDKSR